MMEPVPLWMDLAMPWFMLPPHTPLHHSIQVSCHLVFLQNPQILISIHISGSQALYSSAESGAPITSPSATVPSSHILSSTEPDSIPDLVYRLNRAMATQLIVTNADVVSSPPEYETVAGNPAQIMPTTKQTSENGS